MDSLFRKKCVEALLHPLRDHSWGGTALISLYISILSGIVVGLHYDVADPFYTTTSIELLIPYGSFWRALHYFSSQAFFLLLLVHLATVLWKNETDYKRSAWIRLCLTLPCALLLLFTGYVLRADATGEAAGVIAEHICLAIPVVGTHINDLLFDLSGSGVRKVYIHHVIGLVILGGVAAWPHLRRYTANWNNHLVLVFLTILVSVGWTAPIEPEQFGLLFIAGPWFFLGLQELLRYLSPFVAGVVIPLLPLILLCWLPKNPPARNRWLLTIGFWLLAYAILTFICIERI